MIAHRQGASREIVQRERLSEGDYMYCLYWIRLKDHTDVYTQGYVGISKNFTERMKAHKKNRKHTILTCVIKKYGWDNLTIDILHSTLSKEEALSKEFKYRPHQNIGWNMQRGGEIGVESDWYSIKENSDKHRKATSEATKLGISKKDTPAARSQRAKDNWIQNKASYANVSKGSNNPRAKLTEEQVVCIKYIYIPLGISNINIANYYDVKPYVIQFIKTNKNWKHV